MPITQNALGFLAENRLRDSRDWFNAHKSDYKALIEKPMLELAGQIGERISRVDPAMTLEPRKTLSRLWRDTRFSRDKTVFREEVWLVFRRGKGMEYPAYFFEFSPVLWRYGVGYYSAPPKVMELIRKMVLADDRRYREAQAALGALPGFGIEGEAFKRPRYPEATPEKRDWLERRGLAIIRNPDNPEPLFSEHLPDTLCDAFERLAPVYRFLLDAHLRCAEEVPDQLS